MGEFALRCAELVKRYGNLVAVNRLDLEVATGECFGLLGPNGAGKTTTIEILEGLVRPDGGDVEILGTTWGRDDHALRQRLGIQLQDTRLSEKLTVEETLRLFRSFHRLGRRVDDVLALVELEPKRSSLVGKLSGGQRQRLALACALVGNPEVLFLDEPTTGLDPQSRRQFWGLLDQFKREGGTILITTHYMDEAETVCDRVGIVDQGKLIALGTPAELISTVGAPHVVEFALEGGAVPVGLDTLRSLPGVKDARTDNGRVSLITEHIHLAVPALLEVLDRSADSLSLLSTHSATLEDVFVALTGRHLRDA